jgi:hypothetical protein
VTVIDWNTFVLLRSLDLSRIRMHLQPHDGSFEGACCHGACSHRDGHLHDESRRAYHQREFAWVNQGGIVRRVLRCVHTSAFACAHTHTHTHTRHACSSMTCSLAKAHSDWRLAAVLLHM